MTKPTRISVKIPSKPGGSHVLAFADILFDGHLVVRGYQVIELSQGKIQYRVPVRNYMRDCPACRASSPVTCRFCPQCGVSLPDEQTERSRRGKMRMSSSVIYSTDDAWNKGINDLCVAAYGLTAERLPILSANFNVINWKPGERIKLDWCAEGVGKPKDATETPDEEQ